EDGLVRAEVWSSRPVGGCPQELWQALDAEAIQAASGAAAVGLDGPRQDLLDANRLRPFGGEIRAFGGIAMAQVSTRELNPRELSGGNDYIELSEQRTARGALRAGRQVYELVSDRNLAFVMTSISQRVDPDLSVEELASLGERLALPHGWIWRTRTLEEDLELEAEAKATIVFDEFGNAYERLDYAGAYRVAGLWYDEARNGEGFNVIQSEAGTTVYFYGYDAAGEPLWLVSDTITAALRPGQVVELTAYRGAGGTFEAPVPGAELDVWGTIRMVPLDCNEIAFELTGADGAKLSDAVKLAGITGNQCSESIPAGDYGFALIHDGLLRNYDLHVPPGYDGTPLPLVVDLHGLGGSVGGQRRRNLGLADEEGFLLAVPAGTGLIPSWNAGNCCQPAQDNDVDDVGFVLAVVNDISARTPVDEKRIYATGTSNGGALSHLLACRAADVFAAIAPTAFVLPVDDCQPSRPITVAHFHGLDDTTVPYDGGPSRGGSVVRIGAVESHETWAALNACPNPPTRVLEINDTYCDAYESCAGGVINVLCSVDAGHSLGMNTDLDVARAAWGLISPFSLP
ncbi:MAG: PHB depolymerase family esterase, partial [Pseudomonadota bacterium]